jgi:hypothetical protein
VPHDVETFQKFLDRVDERMTFIERNHVDQAQEEIESQKVLDRIEYRLSLIEQNQSGSNT